MKSSTAERSGDSSCYHGLLGSILGIIEVAGKRSANNADTLTQLSLVLKAELEAKLVSQLTVPF